MLLEEQVNLLNRKKIILFIVEGLHDKISLEISLEQLLKDHKISFHITHGDIFSDNKTTKSNFKDELNLVLTGSGIRFDKSDYHSIVHICDLDGTYISNDSIIFDESAENFQYTEDNIISNNVSNVIARNIKKKELIDIAISTKHIHRTIPYSLYFFSCDLEHVLHNSINVQDFNKRKLAEDFQDKFADDVEGFYQFMCNSDFSINKSYEESWDFIKKDNNSLKRYTNFNIFINNLKTV